MTYLGFVPPDDVKMLADVLSEYCRSTITTCTEEERDRLALRLLGFYRAGLETREALLSQLEAEERRALPETGLNRCSLG